MANEIFVVLYVTPKYLSNFNESIKKTITTNILVANNTEDCILLLLQNPQAIFIVDLHYSSENINKIFEALYEDNNYKVRTTMLLSQENEESSLPLALEFSINELVVGELSANIIDEKIKLIAFKHKSSASELNEVLLKLTDCDEEEILQELKELKDKYPENQAIDVAIGDTYFIHDHFDDLISYLNALDYDFKSNPRLLNLLSRCYLKKGDVDSAIGCLNKAKIMNPHNVERLISLGELYLGSNQIEDAKEHFELAKNLNPELKKAETGTIKANLLQGEIEDALDLLSKSSAEEIASVFNASAILRIKNKDYNSAINLYKIALPMLKDNIENLAKIHFNLGLAYKKNKDDENAKLSFELSNKIFPEFGKAKNQLRKMKK